MTHAILDLSTTEDETGKNTSAHILSCSGDIFHRQLLRCDYDLDNVTIEELVHHLRRQARGSNQRFSEYWGVQPRRCGKWTATFCDLHLGTFVTNKEAAEAYNRAAVLDKGVTAQTNFEVTNYMDLLSAHPRTSCPPHPIAPSDFPFPVFRQCCSSR